MAWSRYPLAHRFPSPSFGGGDGDWDFEEDCAPWDLTPTIEVHGEPLMQPVGFVRFPPTSDDLTPSSGGGRREPPSLTPGDFFPDRPDKSDPEEGQTLHLTDLLRLLWTRATSGRGMSAENLAMALDMAGVAVLDLFSETDEDELTLTPVGEKLVNSPHPVVLTLP